MDDLRVPTNSLPVEIRCTDGRSVLGDIFLPSQSSRQPGPMRPDEWIETAHAFFPFRSQEAGALTIVNRDNVVAVTVPADTNLDPGDAIVETPVYRVAVNAGGVVFEGDIVIDMPPGQQRVADWLNAPEAFITVRAGSVHHLIQKRHVTRVVELVGTPA
ncbi:MAG: hypothetical protein AB7U83_18515 [Vicinamibacterales bacterium]